MEIDLFDIATPRVESTEFSSSPLDRSLTGSLNKATTFCGVLCNLATDKLAKETGERLTRRNSVEGNTKANQQVDIVVGHESGNCRKARRQNDKHSLTETEIFIGSPQSTAPIIKLDSTLRASNTPEIHPRQVQSSHSEKESINFPEKDPKSKPQFIPVLRVQSDVPELVGRRTRTPKHPETPNCKFRNNHVVTNDVRTRFQIDKKTSDMVATLHTDDEAHEVGTQLFNAEFSETSIYRTVQGEDTRVSERPRPEMRFVAMPKKEIAHAQTSVAMNLATERDSKMVVSGYQLRNDDSGSTGGLSNREAMWLHRTSRITEILRRGGTGWTVQSIEGEKSRREKIGKIDWPSHLDRNAAERGIVPDLKSEGVSFHVASPPRKVLQRTQASMVEELPTEIFSTLGTTATKSTSPEVFEPESSRGLERTKFDINDTNTPRSNFVTLKGTISELNTIGEEHDDPEVEIISSFLNTKKGVPDSASYFNPKKRSDGISPAPAPAPAPENENAQRGSEIEIFEGNAKQNVSHTPASRAGIRLTEAEVTVTKNTGFIASSEQIIDGKSEIRGHSQLVLNPSGTKAYPEFGDIPNRMGLRNNYIFIPAEDVRAGTSSNGFSLRAQEVLGSGPIDFSSAA